ncbi:SRPBCC family protein [Micromonospora sp. DT233]|uniref:SRPBCC family protein n=1 Tax=Micromonospora sp. DT233 TaxID=3393432 RepID=UPI003CEF7F51
MSTITVTQFIEAPAVDIWRLLADLPVRADWLTTVGGVELLTAGPLALGTAWREVRTRPDGGAQAEEFVALEVVPCRRLVLTSPGVGVTYRTTWTLHTAERRRRSCTAVTVRQEAIPTAPYGRMLALLFGGLAARAVEFAFRRDLADLARAVAHPPATAQAA